MRCRTGCRCPSGRGWCRGRCRPAGGRSAHHPGWRRCRVLPVTLSAPAPEAIWSCAGAHPGCCRRRPCPGWRRCRRVRRAVVVVVAGDAVGERGANHVLDVGDRVVAITGGRAGHQVDLDTDTTRTGRGVIDRVGAGAAVDGVVPGSGVDVVVTVATVQLVGGGVTADLVVASLTVEDVPDIRTNQDVVPGPTVHVLNVHVRQRRVIPTNRLTRALERDRPLPCCAREPSRNPKKQVGPAPESGCR